MKEQATTVIMTVQDVLPNTSVANKIVSSSHPDLLNKSQSRNHPLDKTSEQSSSEKTANKDLTESQHFTPQIGSAELNKLTESTPVVPDDSSVAQELIENKSSDSESFQDLVSDLVSLEQVMTGGSGVPPVEQDDVVLETVSADSVYDNVLLGSNGTTKPQSRSGNDAASTSKQTGLQSDTVTLKVYSENLQSKKSKNLDTFVQSDLNTLPSSAIANESDLPQILEPEKPEPPVPVDNTSRLVGVKNLKLSSKSDNSITLSSSIKGKVKDSSESFVSQEKLTISVNQNSPASSILKNTTTKDSAVDCDVEITPDPELSPPLIARKYDKVYRPRNGRNSVTANNNTTPSVIAAESKNQQSNNDAPSSNTQNGSVTPESVSVNNVSSEEQKAALVNPPANDTNPPMDQEKPTSLPTESPKLDNKVTHPSLDTVKDINPSPSAPSKPDTEYKQEKSSTVKNTTSPPAVTVNGISEPRSSVTIAPTKTLPSADGSGDSQRPLVTPLCSLPLSGGDQEGEESNSEWLAGSGHSITSSNGGVGNRITDNMVRL